MVALLAHLRAPEIPFLSSSLPNDHEPVTAALDHISLTVSDLDQAVSFYNEAFGFSQSFVVRGMGPQIESITGIEGLDCELSQLHLPGMDVALELIAFRGGADGAQPPIAHLALVVDDLARAVAEVERLGATVLGDVTSFDGEQAVYCREPAGSVFELSERSGTNDE